MRVLIAGAGVAGLSCAVAMRRAGGLQITVIERSSRVAAHGHPIARRADSAGDEHHAHDPR